MGIHRASYSLRLRGADMGCGGVGGQDCSSIEGYKQKINKYDGSFAVEILWRETDRYPTILITSYDVRNEDQY